MVPSMGMNLKSRQTIHLLVLGGMLVLSVLIWFLNPSRVQRRIFFFPRHYVEGTGSEERSLPVQSSDAESVSLYVREYLLGPTLNKLFRILPLQTRVYTVFVADGIAYINLNAKAFERDYESRINFHRGIELMKKGALYNFSGLKDVVVTIEGYEYDTEFTQVDE